VDSVTGIVGLSAGSGVPSDFLQDDLSSALTCQPKGACCTAEAACSFLTAAQCAGISGIYKGDGVSCTPNPCVEYNEECVIISEVVDGTLSGGCPRYIELTNPAVTDFVFLEGGIIVQHGSETDRNVDVNLAGVVIPAGQSITINSNEGGTCTGAFQGAYGFAADVNTQVSFGDGDDRYMITDKADGSRVLDIYGEAGVDGTGRAWEYTKSYAYRKPMFISGRATYFAPQEWYFGGPGALDGPNGEELVHLYTTPGEHEFIGYCTGFDHRGDMNCDWYVKGTDIRLFVKAILNPHGYIGCDLTRADMNGDGNYDENDCKLFVDRLLGL
jgi:hypothetical protein